MSDTRAIDVRGISYSYGNLLAVDDISFSVEPGEILGFLGPNGAGKSTTIKMLTGQVDPKSGSITVLGYDAIKSRAEMQSRIGVCFEEKNLYLNMTAAENLRFFASLFNIADFDPEALLRRVDLVDKSGTHTKGLSKGMRQRLMMARSLVNRPDVLVLDEPTDGLDPVSSRAIRRIIREEADRGAAVILTTHDMEEADKLSDRVAFINEGKIATLDTPENLKLAYGKRSVKVRSRDGDQISEQTVALDGPEAGEELKEAVASPGLMTIHTEEATLENIFIQLTGRGLE